MAAAPMYLSGISLTANVWFPDNERASAGALMTLASPVGSMLSFIIQALYIVKVNQTASATHADVRQATYNMLTVESILITVASLYLIIVIKENPKFPPSKVALTKISSEGSCSDLGKLLKMKNYLLLTFVFACLFATYIALATVINPLLIPFGYDDGVIAELGACFIVAGVLSTLVTGILLDKSKKYLLTLRVITIASCLSAILGYFILPLSNNLLCFVVITLVGLCLVPIMSVGFAFATELTHPI